MVQPISFSEARKRLLPTLRRLFHASAPGFDADAWTLLFNCGKKRDALLYASLFVPSFVEIEGSILYVRDDDHLSIKFSSALKEGKMSLQQLEDSFNLLETSYIFNPGLMEGLQHEDDVLFAQCVAEAWRARLHVLYPNRKFQVSLITYPESGDGCAICFHELRGEETPSLYAAPSDSLKG